MPEPDDDIYDAVYQEDDQEIYDDLCSIRRKPPQVKGAVIMNLLFCSWHLVHYHCQSYSLVFNISIHRMPCGIRT